MFDRINNYLTRHVFGLDVRSEEIKTGKQAGFLVMKFVEMRIFVGF